MAVPWLQIVQLVPSIVDVSRELLRKTKKTSTPQLLPSAGPDAELAQAVVRLEENERRQAELVSEMAEQIARLARAVTVLHQRVIWLSIGFGVSLVAAIAAVVIAVNR